MKFLDSDFMIPLLRKNPSVHGKVEELKGEQLATTTINEFEILHGARLLQGIEHLENATELLAQLKILNFTSVAAQKAAEIHAELTKNGEIIEAKDLFIGSIVLTNNGTLVTRNIKHFTRIPGLKIETW